MLNYALFQKDKIVTGQGIDYAFPDKEEFIWLFLHKPTEEELQKIVQDFQLEPQALRNYSRANHSKRYSTKPFQFVFVDYFMEREKFKSAKLLFILEKNFLITITPQYFTYYDELFKHIVNHFKRQTKRTLILLLYYFLEEDTEENYDVLSNTEALIVSMERRLMLSGRGMMNVDEIISLKRELFHITRRFWASAKIIFAIKKGLTPLTLDTKSMSLFDDIYHTFQHQIDIATAQKEMLSDAMQIYTASISNQLAISSNNINKTMKFLTALTVIIMVPTLVASIFGMNFKIIPLSEWPNGFYWITAGMVISLMFSAIYFVRKDWL